MDVQSCHKAQRSFELEGKQIDILLSSGWIISAVPRGVLKSGISDLAMIDGLPIRSKKGWGT
jgi:hypothetical protein